MSQCNEACTWYAVTTHPTDRLRFGGGPVGARSLVRAVESSAYLRAFGGEHVGSDHLALSCSPMASLPQLVAP